MSDVDALHVPDDLATALQMHPPAAANFESFPPSARRSILRWIASARTLETRKKRIAQTVGDAEQNLRAKSHG